MIKQRISTLRGLMEKRGIDAYIIPSEDFHQSEYVGEYFKARAFISGFTGSAGMVIITMEEACLWTDGRYFIQAEYQLKDTGIKLQKMGNPGVPEPLDYLKEKLPKGGKIGFDGRVVSVDDGKAYEALAAQKRGEILFELDLIDDVWEDRPAFSDKPAFYLSEKYSGESSEHKLMRIREKMDELGADVHILSALDDICWTLNIRGDDVMYSPLVLSYAVITKDEVHLFADEKKFDEEILNSFKEIHVVLHPYNDIYEFVKKISDDAHILIDPNKLNYALYQNIPEGAEKIEAPNPSIVFKAIKNETEVENFRQAHIKDGVAWTKFMYWLKKNIGKIEITEISASDKLEDFRKEQEGYLWPSFAPISGYGPNAAIVHYSSTPETNIPFEAKGLYLSDTGGNYMEGSTDITRTVALGPITDEERYHNTLVLKSHIGLATARFLEGSTGISLDVLARKPFWDRGLDYNHGTGHGIGYLLNVHEAPTGFRYKIMANRNEAYPIHVGMILTIEPGIYIEDKHGIRIENVVIVEEDIETEYGRFFKLVPCTLVPIDLDALDISFLTEEEKDYLNEYHKKVYATISPFLTDEEKEWLKTYTRQI